MYSENNVNAKSGKAILIGLIVLLVILISAALVLGYKIINQRGGISPTAVVTDVNQGSSGDESPIGNGAGGIDQAESGFCGDRICTPPDENNETCQLDCCPPLDNFDFERMDNSDWALTWRSRVPTTSTVRHGFAYDDLTQVIQEEGELESEHRVVFPIGGTDSLQYFFEITYADKDQMICKERIHTFEL